MKILAHWAVWRFINSEVLYVNIAFGNYITPALLSFKPSSP
jgi:hypothetical protein